MPGRGSPLHSHPPFRKDWLSPPSPWHKGQKCKTLAASGFTPALLATGSEGRVIGKAATALRTWDAFCATAKPDGGNAALTSAVWRHRIPSRAGYSGNPALLTAEWVLGMLCLLWQRGNSGKRERPLSPEPRKPWCKFWQCH